MRERDCSAVAPGARNQARTGKMKLAGLPAVTTELVMLTPGFFLCFEVLLLQ